jgi:hypothetical protein
MNFSFSIELNFLYEIKTDLLKLFPKILISLDSKLLNFFKGDLNYLAVILISLLFSLIYRELLFFIKFFSFLKLSFSNSILFLIKGNSPILSIEVFNSSNSLSKTVY